MANNRIFNIELCKRFVSDANLPIPVLNDEEKFFYYLNLYEEHYHSMTKYQDLCDEIDICYKGNVEAFLKAYYDARDKIINDILAKPAYEEFLKADMKQFAIMPKLSSMNVQKGNIFTAKNVGKVFLSVDLCQANFQAMRYFNEDIVNGADSYSEFVSKYIDSEYFEDSKYTRQVIWGKCNPSRQITIEKYLMSKFYENFDNPCASMNLVRFNNDELIFEISHFNSLENEGALSYFLDELSKSIDDTMCKSGVKVSFKIFRLEAMCLHSNKKNEDRDLYYLQKIIARKKGDPSYKFKCVPLTYNAITHKLFYEIDLCDTDYYFRYEGLDAYIDDVFTLKRFKTAEEAITKKRINMENNSAIKCALEHFNGNLSSGQYNDIINAAHVCNMLGGKTQDY